MPQKLPQKILIVRLSAHGDVIQTLPLLGLLKARWPGVSVGWLVEADAAPLLENHPAIDRLHISHRKQWLKRAKSITGAFTVIREVRGFIRELKEEGYTVALDVQGLFKSAVWPWLSSIPRRIGYRATREWADVFYTEKQPPHNLKDPEIPAFIKFMELAEPLGILPETPWQSWLGDIENSYPLPLVSKETYQHIDNLMAGIVSDRPIAALAPATRWTSKEWPPGSWCSVAKALLRSGCQVILLGGPGDRLMAEKLCQSIATEPESYKNLLNLTGKTTWIDLYALFPRIDLLIGPDSAPLHIANAVAYQPAAQHNKKPRIIGLFGPTAPRRTGPVGDQHKALSVNLPCQPCFERICPLKTNACMGELLPEQVLSVVQEQLALSKNLVLPLPADQEIPHGAS